MTALLEKDDIDLYRGMFQGEEVNLGDLIMSRKDNNINKISTELEEHIDDWRYDGEMFDAASRDVEIMGVVPLFAFPLFKFDLILHYNLIFKKIKRHNDNMRVIREAECKKEGLDYDFWLKSRLYQFYTGHLRECNFIMDVFDLFKDESVIIGKNIDHDFKKDIDFAIKINDTEPFDVAIRHKGKTSSKYERTRKKAKTKTGTMVFVATKDYQKKQLDVVPKEEIFKRITGRIK